MAGLDYEKKRRTNPNPRRLSPIVSSLPPSETPESRVEDRGGYSSLIAPKHHLALEHILFAYLAGTNEAPFTRSTAKVQFLKH